MHGIENPTRRAFRLAQQAAREKEASLSLYLVLRKPLGWESLIRRVSPPERKEV